MDKVFDVLTAQTLLLVAVASNPGLQPFFGRRQSDFPCDRGTRYGESIHKNRTLVDELWRDFHARVVEMHPHRPIVHCARHSVS
jgi:hypothetical protein